MIAMEGDHGVDAPPGSSGPVGALLLDLDGTLIDTDAAVSRAVAVSFGSLVGDLDDDAARALALTWLADRDGWFHLYEAGEIDFAEQRRHRYLQVAAELGLGMDQYAAWEPAYVSALIGATAGYPDTVAFLDAVAALPVAIVTNVDTAVQLEKLAVAGLAERFPVVVGVDAADAPKPDPAPFLAACALLGVTPSTAVHVGDSWSADVLGAVGAGLRAVWLDRGRAGAERELPPGVWRVGGLAEVPPMLRSWGLRAT